MHAKDSTQYSAVWGLPGLEVVSAHWVETSFTPHMHDFYIVGLNYAGLGAFGCRRELHHALPGTCNLIGRGELHMGHATSREGWTR